MTSLEYPHSTLLATRIIDFGPVARNMGRVRDITPTPVLAVVKADCFGHGAIEVATTALESGAPWLGVATVHETLVLRSAGITPPVLCWLADPWCDLRAAVAAGLTISGANIETLEAIAALGEAAEVHLELDTGMARGGAPVWAWDILFATAIASLWVRSTVLWSHLALAANAKPEATKEQVQACDRGIDRARELGLKLGILHLANSAGALEHPDTWCELVRCGAALYGIETDIGRIHGLEPSIRVVSRVTQLKRVAASTGVSDNHAWVASTDTTLVPVGYGIPRDLSHGDGVALLGLPDDGEPDSQERAAVTGTVAHETFTGLGGRMARRRTNQTKGTLL
jgi:alanine racemase